MFLVTTADESTWDYSRKICYLGAWCLRYSRRDIWKYNNPYLLPYHWDDRSKYNRDYYYLERVYEDCLILLSSNLDRINCTHNGANYWRIVIGPWLRFFIDVLYDRFEVIRTAAESGVADDTWILPYELNDWVPDGFTDFYESINDDRWNHIIFAECIRAIGLPNSKKTNVVKIKPQAKNNKSKSRKHELAKNLFGIYQKLIPHRFNRHVAVSPYFGHKYVARLQFALRQLPYFLTPSVSIYDTPVDIEKRSVLSIYLDEYPFELLLGKLIPQCLPKAYLEDFTHYHTNEFDKFPKKPVTIFTANAYQAHDGFKYWAAENQKVGVPLVIGQHGGNMGIAHHNQTEDHQLKIADSYCSWGWRRSNIDSINPMPSLQLSNSTLSEYPNGDILLVLASYPRYFYCHYSVPVAGQFLEYLNQQILLINTLNEKARSLIRIRLNGDEYGWDIIDRLNDLGLGEMIDESVDQFELSVSKSRLCIVSYNATLILETLHANFPTVAYWDPYLFDVRPEALPFLNILREVGILHDTVESASNFISEIYDDIQSWWKRPELQIARLKFCNMYANSSDDWIAEWKNHFNSVKMKANKQ